MTTTAEQVTVSDVKFHEILGVKNFMKYFMKYFLHISKISQWTVGQAVGL